MSVLSTFGIKYKLRNQVSICHVTTDLSFPAQCPWLSILS